MLRILWYREKNRQKGETGKEGWEGGQIMGGLNTMVRSSVNCGQALAQEKVVAVSELCLAGLAVASEPSWRGDWRLGPQWGGGYKTQGEQEERAVDQGEGGKRGRAGFESPQQAVS